MVSQPLNSGAQPRSAVETAVLECTRGRWNSWCSGEMLRYHEELRLRRQLTGVLLTLMTVKLKGIDGGPHKRRNMWFNSMIREEPYPGLKCT